MFSKNTLIKTKMMTEALEKEVLDVTGAIIALTETKEFLERIRRNIKELENQIAAAVKFAEFFEVDAESEYKKYHRTKRPPKRILQWFRTSEPVYGSV